MSAFNGDSFIEAHIAELVRKWSVATIVETGTYEGDSTKVFARLVPFVVTIEIDWLRFELAAREFNKIDNIRRLYGDSREILGEIVSGLYPPILFYLDAHWSAHSPLLDELNVIAMSKLSKAIIVIHDFFNPLHPDYTFDCWDIGPYRLELITATLDRIYGNDNWRHHFNDKSDAKPARGVLYVEPRSEIE